MASTFENKHLTNIYTNYVNLLYYKREKSNTVGKFLDGEVNALSASSNRIRDGKSKQRKESSTVSVLTPRRYTLVLLSDAKNFKSNTGSFTIIEIDYSDLEHSYCEY